MSDGTAKVLVGLDRDGTINAVIDSRLGELEDWRKRVELLPGVLDGLRRIKKIPNARTFIATNQDGVALNGEPHRNLDMRRAREVNQFIINKLDGGILIDASFICPFVDKQYARRASEKGRTIIKSYYRDNHVDRKPNPGMIKKAARKFGTTVEESEIFFIGDAITDVLTGIRAGGIGILVPTRTTRRNEIAEARRMQQESRNQDRVEIADTLLNAAALIERKVLDNID